MSREFDCYPLPLSYSRFHEALSGRSQQFTPSGIQRCVQLACVLEPMVETRGKTTRNTDFHPVQRLPYYLTAGVNIGETFRILAERLFPARELVSNQPIIYDLATQAQIDSKRQRRGGRVNQGIIEMLTPLVAGQILYLGEQPCPENITSAFGYVGTVLQNTGPEDVESLVEMHRLAFTMSGYYERAEKVHSFRARTVYEFYNLKGDLSITPSDAYHCYELTHNLPTARHITEAVLQRGQSGSRFSSFEELFTSACLLVQGQLPENYPPGLVADATAVSLYVLLSHFPNAKIVC